MSYVAIKIDRAERYAQGDRITHKRLMGPFYFHRIIEDFGGIWVEVTAPGVSKTEAYRPESFANLMVREVSASGRGAPPSSP